MNLVFVLLPPPSSFPAIRCPGIVGAMSYSSFPLHEGASDARTKKMTHGLIFSSVRQKRSRTSPATTRTRRPPRTPSRSTRARIQQSPDRLIVRRTDPPLAKGPRTPPSPLPASSARADWRSTPTASATMRTTWPEIALDSRRRCSLRQPSSPRPAADSSQVGRVPRSRGRLGSFTPNRPPRLFLALRPASSLPFASSPGPLSPAEKALPSPSSSILSPSTPPPRRPALLRILVPALPPSLRPLAHLPSLVTSASSSVTPRCPRRTPDRPRARRRKEKIPLSSPCAPSFLPEARWAQ